MKCLCCEDTGWVCENHPDRPFFGDCAYDCGGAGAPCPVCNRTDPGDPDDVPEMPEGFVVEGTLRECLRVGERFVSLRIMSILNRERTRERRRS